jgi:serine/threonine protein kinase
MISDNSEQESIFEGLQDGQLVAVKKVAITQETTDQVSREKEASRSKSSCTAIIRIFTIESDSSHYFIPYERCLMSLETFTDFKRNGEDRQKFPEMENIILKDILLDILKGLDQFHKVTPTFAHRNIRPHSILITQQDGKFVGKISNLALSKKFELDRDTQSVSGSFNPQKVVNLCISKQKIKWKARPLPGLRLVGTG